MKKRRYILNSDSAVNGDADINWVMPSRSFAHACISCSHNSSTGHVGHADGRSEARNAQPWPRNGRWRARYSSHVDLGSARSEMPVQEKRFTCMSTRKTKACYSVRRAHQKKNQIERSRIVERLTRPQSCALACRRRAAVR